MTAAEPSALFVDFDNYDLTDPVSVAKLRTRAAESLNAIDATIIESAANYKLQIGIAAGFVRDAQKRAAMMEASYRKHVAELNEARFAADAVLQFSRRCSACLG